MSFYDLASELQTYFRSSLFSLGKEEGEKRRPDVRRQFAGEGVICNWLCEWKIITLVNN